MQHEGAAYYYVLIANSLKYNQLLAVAENLSYKGPNYTVSGNTPNYLTTFCLLHRTSFTTEVGNAHTLKRVVGHLAARAKRSLSRTFHRLFQRSYSSHEVQKNSTDMHIYACLGSPVLLLMSDRTRK